MEVSKRTTFGHWGFNRYMVECELFCRSDKLLKDHVLIDTWWNVNLYI